MVGCCFFLLLSSMKFTHCNQSEDSEPLDDDPEDEELDERRFTFPARVEAFFLRTADRAFSSSELLVAADESRLRFTSLRFPPVDFDRDRRLVRPSAASE